MPFTSGASGLRFKIDTGDLKRLVTDLKKFSDEWDTEMRSIGEEIAAGVEQNILLVYEQDLPPGSSHKRPAIYHGGYGRGIRIDRRHYRSGAVSIVAVNRSPYAGVLEEGGNPDQQFELTRTRQVVSKIKGSKTKRISTTSPYAQSAAGAAIREWAITKLGVDNEKQISYIINKVRRQGIDPQHIMESAFTGTRGGQFSRFVSFTIQQRAKEFAARFAKSR